MFESLVLSDLSAGLLLAEESSLLFVEDCLNHLDGVKVTYYLAGYSKRKMSLQSYYKVWLSAIK